MLTLVPTYGRDYKSPSEVKEDFHLDKDFIIQDISSKWSGKPANKTSIIQYTNHEKVRIRYSDKTKVTVLDVHSNNED